ncbi:helix-turn-helix domain-containing protein [Ligilactobacillus faecis]|uniref:helix-turn-helix domain-containing protein n=1 Tax=Ligilactobacillus faecis TaxID=762833 RepID=UPI0024693DE0|nr:helix-turn-helix transcriptional regulator [Ligilactobacillus faecis]WGN89796.1 helix-turn-helix transcriptional regulator [Ligilactobacillus faecis]
MENRIRELRAERGLTLANLANNTGLAVSTISQYEKGDRKPKIEAWQKLADYFGVSVGYLQGIEEKSQTDAGRQQRWNKRKEKITKALREGYMNDESWESIYQRFKREWDAHELEERRVQGDGNDDTR